MITAAQLRAARGLIDWTRNELAKAANVSPETIKNIEHGIFRPQEETAQRIISTFMARGVEFTDNEGVRVSKGSVRSFEGKKGYLDFLEDICATMKNGGRTCQFNYSDSIISTYGNERISEYSKQLSSIQNLDARCLVPEGDLNFPVQHCVYKWLQKAHQDAIPYYAYGNKVAMLASGPNEEMVWISIHSDSLAKAFYKQFDLYWENALVPPRSKQVKRA